MPLTITLVLTVHRMASKLCCTAEQEGRPGSPALPNARVSQATPTNQPLLPTQIASPGSRFTSARSEELHELRQIFENAQDEASPTKAPRARGSRLSMYSLHTIASVRSILRKKFSSDFPKSNVKLLAHQPKGKAATRGELDTMIKHAKEDSKLHLNVTKSDLRKNLLSDKEPAEGGYDSDAHVLDDVARHIGKKIPSKRPSIHSVEWPPSIARFSVFPELTLYALTWKANPRQTHPPSTAIALSSNGTCSPTRLISPQRFLSLHASPKSSVPRTYVEPVPTNVIASCVAPTRPPPWGFRDLLRSLLCDCPVSLPVITMVWHGLM
jgi:hypothetical protein